MSGLDQEYEASHYSSTDDPDEVVGRHYEQLPDPEMQEVNIWVRPSDNLFEGSCRIRDT